MEEKDSGLFILAGAEINPAKRYIALAFFDDYETLDVFSGIPRPPFAGYQE
jgi:hypothetical protein